MLKKFIWEKKVYNKMGLTRDNNSNSYINSLVDTIKVFRPNF